MNFSESDVIKLVEENSFAIVSKSVHDKNQTRFMHLIVRKDGKDYFCKVNKKDEVLETHINSSLSKYFLKPPAKIHFMSPVQIIKDRGLLLYLYDYIGLPAVSNESKKFKDFNVEAAELELYFTSMISAVDFVAMQEVVTAFESQREAIFEHELLQLMRTIDTDVPHGLEFIKYLLNEGQVLKQKTLAINDIQPQNSFWKSETKELYIFDLEHIGPNYKYYDFARYSSYLWFIYEKPEYAKQFLTLAFSSSNKDRYKEKYAYIKFNLVNILLRDLCNFPAAPTQKLITDMLAWVREDMPDFVNSLI